MLLRNIGILVGSVIVIATLTLTIMRLIVSKIGRKELIEDGILAKEDCIEYMGFFFSGTRKAPYDELQSVELVSYFELILKVILMRYGLSARNVCAAPFSKTLVVQLKHPNPTEYLFFTPKNADALYNQIKSRIQKPQLHRPSL